MDAMIQVKDLHIYFKTYAGLAKAVQGVDLILYPGEILGLVGESGSGKSVTGLSMMGLIPKPAGFKACGQVLIDGQELYELKEKEKAKLRGEKVAMIFQEPMTSLNPVFKVEEQIGEALRVHRGISKKEQKARVIELLKSVRIPSPEKIAQSYPHQLSGGMRQRVMIAMALSCHPQVIIADEPTTALDVSIQAQILDLMQELVEKMSISILFITHDLGVISQIAHRIAVMYCGEIVETGMAEDVLKDPGHPYTKGLIAARPENFSPKDGYSFIPGRVPSLYELPQGCYFSTRCPFVMEKCLVEHPPLVGEERSCRCFLWGGQHE